MSNKKLLISNNIEKRSIYSWGKVGSSLNIFYILYKERYFCGQCDNIMKKKIFLILTICAASLTSCSKNEEMPRTEEKSINVTLGLPLAIESRTEVAEDGSVSWVAGDKIALWAKNSAGSYTLGGNVLSMLHYSTSRDVAYFSANIPAMSEGSYTYYASSPAPTSVNGTKASYTIPAVQDGSNNLMDVMVASAVTAPQLVDGENNLDLRFTHVLHAIKVTIPEDGNLLGKPITAFKMVFPAAIAGDITIDASRPRISPTLTNGTNSIMFEFDEPKQAGDSFWAVIYPAFLYGDISYTAYSDGYESKSKSFNIYKQLEAGHVTPMELTIPTLNKITTIRFSLGDNYLGEDIIGLTIKDSKGNALFSYSGNKITSVDTVFDGEWSVPSYSGQTLTAEFESENAIVSSTFKMPALTPYITNAVPNLTVPYLFYEDFSGINASESFSETTRSSNPSGNTLDKYGLTGWSIARGGISAGACVRVNCSFETGLTASADYKGQVDSPFLTNIKSGKSVTVKVQFCADSSEESTACYVGNISTSGAVNAETGISNGTSLTLMAKSGISYSDYFTERVVNVPNTSRSSRIAFESNSQRSGELTLVEYYDHFVYIDNIRISIAQ